MIVPERYRATSPEVRYALTMLAVTMVGFVTWQFEPAINMLAFVVSGMIGVTPLVAPGIILAAWIAASGAGDRVAALFYGHPLQAITATTLVGAFLPVCGVTVLPLMTGLLAAGVPLAPVMAFWLASPITGPAMLSATVATLGWEFAVGKTLAAIGLGLFGGFATLMVAQYDWARRPLRENRLVNSMGNNIGTCHGTSEFFDPWIWRDAQRRSRFLQEAWSITRLILLVLTPAFAAEHLLNSWLRPDALSAYVGTDTPFAIPLAVLVGGPAYIDGYAALPLTRSLIDHGMSAGAAMAFLVAGGVASVWGAMAIFPVLKLMPFLLYLALAASGSMLAGWVFGGFY
ncbi:MAG: permease [Pseudomonadota bacterium]